MYRYDEYDQGIVDERVAQFRDQTARFFAGKLREDEFRTLRLRNGLYLQRFAPMLRVAIPYGLLSSKQVRMLAHIARKYDRGYGHFSTRQNIQYNWPRLEETPDILADLASVQMHAIQTSGNCIRNITTDHLAGVAKDEIEDPRPYCEIARQWSTFHPEFNFLPRKFKIAFSATATDRAAIRVHDIGIQLVKNEAGELGFKFYAGGGLGRTPFIGPCIREYVPREHLLSYAEAIMRVYNRLGQRGPKALFKSRIKILVRDLGKEKFTELVEKDWEKIKATNDYLRLTDADIERMKARFDQFTYDPRAASDQSFEQKKAEDKAFAAWAKHNLAEHRAAGYKAVFISLKAPGIPPGDCTHEQMDVIADLADQYSFGEVRTTHNQNLILADVQHKDLYALWQRLREQDLATPNIGTLADMICCPGLDFCALANAGSIGIAAELNERFDDLDHLYDLGEIQIKMSGCMNGCGHHSVGHIGILGVEKIRKIKEGGQVREEKEEWYQLTLGGSAANDASLGDRIGPSLAKDQVVDAIGKILDVFVERREEDERFVDCYRRIGMEPFKSRVYAGAEGVTADAA
ncbi:MAG: nitrite/sulfite reductase [Nevskiales bacterium]